MVGTAGGEEVGGLRNLKHMRSTSKRAHGLSDAFIQGKQALSFADPRIWLQLLAAFFHVYWALEEELRRHQEHPIFVQLAPQLAKLGRSAAFLDDIMFHSIGADKADGVKRPPAAGQVGGEEGEGWAPTRRVPAFPEDPEHPVALYVKRIHEVANDDPAILLAYCDTMYMAILAGGSILKRALKAGMGLQGDMGSAIFTFPGMKPSDLRALRDGWEEGVNSLPLSEAQREAARKEHQSVFARNDEVIRVITAAAPLSSYLMLWAHLARQLLSASYVRGAIALVLALIISQGLGRAGLGRASS